MRHLHSQDTLHRPNGNQASTNVCPAFSHEQAECEPETVKDNRHRGPRLMLLARQRSAGCPPAGTRSRRQSAAESRQVPATSAGTVPSATCPDRALLRTADAIPKWPQIVAFMFSFVPHTYFRHLDLATGFPYAKQHRRSVIRLTRLVFLVWQHTSRALCGHVQ